MLCIIYNFIRPDNYRRITFQMTEDLESIRAQNKLFIIEGEECILLYFIDSQLNEKLSGKIHRLENIVDELNKKYFRIYNRIETPKPEEK